MEGLLNEEGLTRHRRWRGRSWNLLPALVVSAAATATGQPTPTYKIKGAKNAKMGVPGAPLSLG
jgi:hypothetical protein